LNHLIIAGDIHDIGNISRKRQDGRGWILKIETLNFEKKGRASQGSAFCCVLREEVAVAFLVETLPWLSCYIDARVAAQVLVLVFAFEIAAAGIRMAFFAIFITLFVVVNFIRHFVPPNL
jgi:hypothetical protein